VLADSGDNVREPERSLKKPFQFDDKQNGELEGIDAK
jgi:hypothetical protein